jgi:hypothetical protein
VACRNKIVTVAQVVCGWKSGGRRSSGAKAHIHIVRLNVRAEARTFQDHAQIGLFQQAVKVVPFQNRPIVLTNFLRQATSQRF